MKLSLVVTLVLLAVIMPGIHADDVDVAKRDIQVFGRRIIKLYNGEITTWDELTEPQISFLERLSLNDEDFHVGLAAIFVAIICSLLVITCCCCCCCCCRRKNSQQYFRPV